MVQNICTKTLQKNNFFNFLFRYTVSKMQCTNLETSRTKAKAKKQSKDV